MEIKDNELLRQFEINTDTGLVTIEYSLQERKIFLTKFCSNGNEDEDLQADFLRNVLEIADERKLKVVPTHAKIISSVFSDGNFSANILKKSPVSTKTLSLVRSHLIILLFPPLTSFPKSPYNALGLITLPVESVISSHILNLSVG